MPGLAGHSSNDKKNKSKSRFRSHITMLVSASWSIRLAASLFSSIIATNILNFYVENCQYHLRFIVNETRPPGRLVSSGQFEHCKGNRLSTWYFRYFVLIVGYHDTGQIHFISNAAMKSTHRMSVTFRSAKATTIVYGSIKNSTSRTKSSATSQSSRAIITLTDTISFREDPRLTNILWNRGFNQFTLAVRNEHIAKLNCVPHIYEWDERFARNLGGRLRFSRRQRELAGSFARSVRHVHPIRHHICIRACVGDKKNQIRFVDNVNANNEKQVGNGNKVKRSEVKNESRYTKCDVFYTSINPINQKWADGAAYPSG